MPKDEVKHAVFDLFDRDDNNIVAAETDRLSQVPSSEEPC